jgi:antitoxin CptB
MGDRDHRASRFAMVLQAVRSALTHGDMDRRARLSRARFRAWHRGTREADYMIGGFYERYHREWDEEALAWFEVLLEEDDVDVMAWAMRAEPVPERLSGPQMTAMQRLDYVKA